jgi:hypothetical protein
MCRGGAGIDHGELDGWEAILRPLHRVDGGTQSSHVAPAAGAFGR